MGVKSLQSFLRNNQAYFADSIVFNNSVLVIDANNLLCQIFVRSILDKSSSQFRHDVYGGDFVLYSKLVREFFGKLKSCYITPILVFDGSVIGKAVDSVASKEKEVYKRGLDKFERAKTFQENPTEDESLFPQILGAVFRKIITELNITTIQTVYEADSHIARLANEHNCPVLTNDSDFIIYALKRGFILLDLFDHQNSVRGPNGKPAINCLLFSQSKITKSMAGLRPQCLPLMSIILGNDYVEADTFESVVGEICNVPYNGFLDARSYNHRRIANLLTWLRRRTLDEAINYILDLVHPNHHEKLKKSLKMYMRNYNIEEFDDFEAEMNSIYNSGGRANDKGELQPAIYLRKVMTKSDVSIALDMIFHNTYYNYHVVDDFRLPTSGYPRYRPYSLALALLRPQSYANQTTYRRKILSEKDSFYICDRLDDRYSKLILRPLEELENFGSLEHLDCHTMISLEPALKKNIMMSCFYTNSEEINLITDTVGQVLAEAFVKEATTCMLLVKYVGLESKMPPKPQFVEALMLTIFFYAACSASVNKQNLPDPSAYGHLLLRLRSHSTKVNDKIYEPNDQGTFRRIMHFISQLQSAYKGYLLVNELLNCPLHSPSVALFMNGTLIYRLTKLLRFQRDKLDDICKGVPILMDICDSVKLLVQSQT